MKRRINQAIADTLNAIAMPFWILADKLQHDDYWNDRRGVFVRIGDALENVADRFDENLKQLLTDAWHDYKALGLIHE